MRVEVQRHRTALRRTRLSRPMQCGLDDGLVSEVTSIFDYGCGHGDDVRELRARGFVADGWDPSFQPDSVRREADVVNLGFVLNVIEDPEERAVTLRAAWALARSTLIVSARLDDECEGLIADEFNDGVLTRRGTFQKFFRQDELRGFVESVLETRAVAAAPGIFYVFRDEGRRQEFLASRVRRPTRAALRLTEMTQAFEELRPAFEQLLTFLRARGRVPSDPELPDSVALKERFGSFSRAVRVLCTVVPELDIAKVQEERTEDLLIYLALSAFDGRPSFAALSRELQLDVRALFGSYRRACVLADTVLAAVGDQTAIDRACRRSKVGKLTPAALYVHTEAILELDPLLRIYEGCARAIVGTVPGVNILKLHRDKPQISYLRYPTFLSDPHPSLEGSLLVSLRTFELQWQDYSRSQNPPILHRKEEFVGPSHPHREQFERLTRQEERAGLFADPSRIGTLDGWRKALRAAGVKTRGHRLVKDSATAVKVARRTVPPGT